MKDLISVLITLLFISLPIGAQAKNLTVNYSHDKLSPNVIIKSTDHTFERVFQDGTWWIYEYDKDGGLVNIYPADE